MRYFLFVLLSAYSFAQQVEHVDFLELKAILSPNATTKSIAGEILYTFNVKSDIDTIRIDAKNMDFKDVKINGKIVDFKKSITHLLLFEGFKKGKNSLTFNYSATPKQTLYFIGEGNDLQIWTQGQGRYTSHWLPSFDDVNEKVIFNLTIEYDKRFHVISNGNLKKEYSQLNNDVRGWSYRMQKPMSSYLVMLAIGNFSKNEEKAQSGIPLEFYLDRNDADKFEPTYRYSKVMFDFFEKEIGVNYPWKIYRQVPVRDFLYAGMENTTATIFAQDYVVDEIGFNDRNYVNVNAHELAHQWFGDMITARSGKHHWLQEGFATYYALLAEKKVFGDDYFYHQLYKTANQLRNAAKTDTIPVMNEKASSLTFYQKGAWALHVLKESIGEKSFRKAVKTYLKKYKFKNVETDDFLREVNNVSDFDTDSFKKVWLEQSGFEYQQAIKLLTQKNSFIAHYIEIKKQKEVNNTNIVSNLEDYRMLMKSEVYYPIKQEIILQTRNLDFESNKELVELAMNSNQVQVRQTVARSLPKVPSFLKSDYEKLLTDTSYLTREIAFVNLWNSFPDERPLYLDRAKEWIGNNDKSSRILYLLYAQFSQNLVDEQKLPLYNELVHYTSSNFESSIRENAFDALLQFSLTDENVIRNLIQATTHFKWRFNSYAKEELKKLLIQVENKILIQKLLPTLPSAEQVKVQNLLPN